MDHTDYPMSGHDNALHAAAAAGHLQIVNFLMEQVSDEQKEGALASAAAEGQLEVVKYLVGQGMSVNDTATGAPALYWALCRRHTVLNNNDEIREMVKYLVEQGADVNAKGNGQYNDGFNMLELAIMWAGVEMIQYLVKHGANVKVKTERGNGLHTAVNNRNLEAIKYLVTLGEDANEEDSSGHTALHNAALEGLMEEFLCLTEEVGIRNLQDIVKHEAFSKWENIHLYAAFIELADKLCDEEECQRFCQQEINSEIKQEDRTKKLVYTGTGRSKGRGQTAIPRIECPYDLSTAFINRFKNKMRREGVPDAMWLDPERCFEDIRYLDSLKTEFQTFLNYINAGRDGFVMQASSLVALLESTEEERKYLLPP